MKYPYADLTYFCPHKHYSYAKCAGKDFFSSWVEHRQNIISILKEKLKNNNFSETRNYAIPETFTAFTLYEYLKDILEKISSCSIDLETLKEKINPFQKKFEVFHKLFNTYNSHFRKTADAESAGISCYIKLARVLIELEKRTQNLFYLSTTLKLTDAVCSTLNSGNFTREDLDDLLYTLTAEQTLVNSLI